MNNLAKKILNGTVITIFVMATFFVTGCGDSETAKEITNAAKKSIEGEVAKTKEEIKKQLDQVIPGAGNGQKENGKDAAKSGKEKSEKDSDDEDSSKEKD